MAKQDVLNAINETIVANGVKGINADSLRNILTMMVENAGEGGSGEGALRVMMFDMFISESAPDVNQALFDEMETFFTGFAALGEAFLSHNANVYAQLIEKARAKEGAMVIIDGSLPLYVTLNAMGQSEGLGEMVTGLSYGNPAEAKIIETTNEGEEFFGETTSITLYPCSYSEVTYSYIELFADGSVRAYFGQREFMYVPEEGGVLTDAQKEHNKTFYSASMYQDYLRRVKLVDEDGESGPTTSYSSIIICGYNEVTYFDGIALKKASLLGDGSVTVTTLGTLN